MDPVILFFALGLVAGLARSELRLPPAIYELLSVLLLLTIGLKGGIELAQQPFGGLLPQIIAVMAMGIVIPLMVFPVLRYVGRLDRPNAASIAAHYGSVSVATYAVGIAYLASQDIFYEPRLALFLVLLEMPAIMVGIVLARGISKDTRWGKLAHETFLGKSIVLLMGGLIIGWIAGPVGMEPLEPFFFDLFKGVLALFLLEMGLIAASQFKNLKDHGFFLVVFALLVPVPLAMMGALLGWWMGLSEGGTMLLAVLSGSCSYIAAPAAMRIAVPEASPTLSLTASLGVTFPFNIFVGIPLYLGMAQYLHTL
ncbi:MAG TPA: sodium-dependent bicarbonate transport family permease [Xanthomonadales bacterium]|nr:sodium-dependent bicarbonate transport family permease [Xanthomonadales bacterium]